ncbi:MAG: DUF2157 domain-containing protein [Kiritimatiellaeota bacterium]|nr:DUF2157 domain-containing protein [Kiritimatiellota bacterium]
MMADKNQHRWLQGEVQDWVREGLVAPEQADAIRRRYPLPAEGPAWGVIIFSSIGAVIAGLGIILLFAYNWAAIPKAAKLAMVFGALGGLHGAGLRLFLATPQRNLGEGLCLLGTMLFGAGLWLVAQIYHIEEHYPTAFLVWGLGAAALALAMPSIPQALLATVLLSIWCGMERFGFEAPRYFAPLALAAVLGPLAWWRRSSVLLAALIPAFMLTTVFVLPGLDRHPWLIFSTVLNLGAIWIALRFLVRSRGGFPGAWRLFGLYGWGSFYLALYILCFPAIARHMLRETAGLSASVLAFWIGQLALTGLAWARVFFERVVQRRGVEAAEPGFEIYTVPLLVLLAVGGVLAPDLFAGWTLSGPCNLVFLGLTASLLLRGCRQSRLGPVVIGSILLVALSIARYFDLFESLWLRGLIFLAVGGVLFAEGFLYSKNRRQKSAG